MCVECENGFYFDKESKQCSKCPSGSISCLSDKNSVTCDVKHFKQVFNTIEKKQEKLNKQDNPLSKFVSLFFGAFMQKVNTFTINKNSRGTCVLKCSNQGNHMDKILLTRKCPD